MYDIIIIGAGVIGCSIARELSKYSVRTAVIEKHHDVCMGTSKANSAIVHAGHDAKPGSIKAKMNLAGNPMFDTLSKELDFPFRRIGSLVLRFEGDPVTGLEELKKRGENNGVKGLEILSREKLLEIEPNIGSSVQDALISPTGGITCPYEMTLALAENAASNGVEFFLGHEVIAISHGKGSFNVKTSAGEFHGKVLINAAGLFADEIHNMLSPEKLRIIPRAGQYALIDKSVDGLIKHTLFQLPGKMGKGILVTPTVDGNVLFGPTATDQDDKLDTGTTPERYGDILRAAGRSLLSIPSGQVITAFTGLRAHSVTDDFIIGHVPGVPGMIDVAGIESPGLSSAPAIGAAVKELAGELIDLQINPRFNPIREGIPKFREMDYEERARMIDKNPAYGRIICRCENVSEAEIIAAIHRYPGARDLDGVKRRVRVGMGRCQGGFCSPQTAMILARELGIPITEVTKSGPGSNILTGHIGKER